VAAAAIMSLNLAPSRPSFGQVRCIGHWNGRSSRGDCCGAASGHAFVAQRGALHETPQGLDLGRSRAYLDASMIKITWLLASAAAASAVWAEPAKPAAAAPLSAMRSYVDLASSGSGFDCAPAPIGGGTAPTFRSNAAGSVAWWYCATPNGQWRVNWAAATAEQMSARNLFAQFRAVLTANDRKAAFNAAVARNVTTPVNAPALTAVWQPFVAEMSAGKPSALPVASLTAPVAGGTLSTMLAWAL